MTILASRLSVALALGAVCSMTATPALARGWGDHHWRSRDRGIDGGDILAGVLILGGIAAVASAASKSRKESREPDYRTPDRDYRGDGADYRGDYPGGPAGGDDPQDYGDRGPASVSDARNAVDSCVDAVERGQTRVRSVDAVNRDRDGWRVEGRADDGRDFSCSLDRDGRIRGIGMDGA